MLFNWQQDDWRNFRFDHKSLEPMLATYAEQSARLSGLLQGLKEDDEERMKLNLMIEEAIRTSSIEGEFLSREDVMSSIKNHLGAHPKKQIDDLRAAGIGELMTIIRRDFKDPLDQASLFAWHETLMQGSSNITLGAWRTAEEAMRVVSGRLDNPTIHFEAPPSKQVPDEMKHFFDWFNMPDLSSHKTLSESPIKAGIAHLYFESIHPFEDGNGRIGRAISDKALAQGAGRFAVAVMRSHHG